MRFTIPGRIHIIGNSGSGKSTLATRLAALAGAPVVELDALNREPGWVGLNETDPAEFERRIRNATSGAAWVVAGSYSGFAKRVFWPRAECVIWLDFSVPVLVWRVLRRSWRRWRTRELLWGTNRERSLPQLAVWSKKSLVWWILSRQRRKRREMRAAMLNPQWAHIRFLRLATVAEIEALVCAFVKTSSPPLQEGTNLYHYKSASKQDYGGYWNEQTENPCYSSGRDPAGRLRHRARRPSHRNHAGG